MKKLISLLLVAMMILSLAACGPSETEDPSPSDTATEATTEPSPSEAPSPSEKPSDETAKVGVSMPTQSLQRWNQDGANMKEQLEAAGYDVDLQYAGDNDIPTQVSQLENMISGGCDVLVIAAIDGSSLTTVLEQAKANDIPVIAYDRLIMNTDAVSYYATFDNFQVGVAQAQYIVDALDLENTDGPYNIELFTGSPDDNNIYFLFDGAMEVLQPYIDEGKLVVPSGQTEITQCATPKWSTEESQMRMENLITSNGYGPSGTKLDAVMSNNDSVAQGISNALVAAGYTKDDFPVITGQDCDVTSVKNIIAGTQAMSVFKDTRTLAAQTVKMVDAILKGGEPEINDTKSYDNGTGIIPTYLCELIACDVTNYEKVLIDSEYYTVDQIS